MIIPLLHIVFLILFVYLSVITIYFFIIAIAGRLKHGYPYSSFTEKKKIALLIPSYKEDNIIIDTATRAKNHDYPTESFDVFVIADKLKKETIETMRALPVNVIEVQFDISMKAKSLHYALETIGGDKYDIAMVLDADNVMGPGCLEKVNHAFHNGFKVAQCNRIAKNKNNQVAILDTISEEVNNHFFRRSQRAFGLSASLIGSGMAFEFDILRNIFSMPIILDNAGEDKEIDLQLMKLGITTEFIEAALVYDEKVSSTAVFEKQRIRWLESHLNNLKRYFDADMKALSKKRIYWYRLFQTMLLPRSLYILLFLLIFLGFLVQFLIHVPIFFPSFLYWLLLPIIYIIALALCIPSQLYNRDLLKAILHLPILIFTMVKALLKMKPNRKEFLHTPKVHTSDSQ